MSSSLCGAGAVIATMGVGLGERLAAALTERGARVVLVCDQPSSTQVDFSSIVTDFSSRAELERAFAAAERQLDGIDLLLHVALPDLLMESRNVEAMTDEQWQGGCEAALLGSFHCLQAAHGPLARRAAAVIQLGPSTALLGASGLLALCTAAEAQRGLAKSAARQWGADGIRVNWIALAPQVFSPLLASADLPKRSEAIPLPLGICPDLENDLLAMIESLLGDAGKRVSGLLLNLDGGEWMLP